MVKRLIDVGASLNVVVDNPGHESEGHDTPLQAALKARNHPLVDTLLAAGANPNQCTDWGPPVLGLAARAGDIDSMRLLLAHGAKINASCNLTALTAVASDGKPDMVSFLLSAGADVNIVSTKGVTGDETALAGAAKAGHIEIMQTLLAAHADVHKRGDAALFAAISGGQVEAVRILLAAGANANARDPLGGPYATPLALAEAGGGNDHSTAILDLLRERGARP